MPTLLIYLKFLFLEVIQPINYAAAFLIGATINIAQGNTIFFSLVPYVVPVLVQAFTKASVKYGNRKKEILLMLPGECKDPAFVMNAKGKILASTGNSYNFFQNKDIKGIQQLFEIQGAQEVFGAVDESIQNIDSIKLELFSDLEQKWYQIQVKANPSNPYILVWLEDISERKTAELNLAERMRHFEFMSEIGFMLTKSGKVNEIIQKCTESMINHLGAVFARIWILNKKDNVLHLTASAGKYTHIDGQHSRIPVGEKKIGMIAKTCKPHLSNAVIGDPAISDQDWAKREGMCAFAGHPLIFEDRIIGVIAMFSTQILSDSTIKSLKAVADFIALGIVQKQVKEKFEILSDNKKSD
jgi:hypothetical protein